MTYKLSHEAQTIAPFSIKYAKNKKKKISPENPFPAKAVPSNGVRMLHTHTIEIQQSHQIQQDMYPKVELYNITEVHASINYSSSEMRIANSLHRGFASACVKLL